MIRRSFFAILGAAALFLAAGVSAFAWTGEVDGHPTLAPDSPVGYYLWHDEDGMHLRTHGPGDEHLFTARLHTDGLFEDVQAVRLESADSFKVTNGGHTLLLRFHTYDWTDGLNFRVQGGEYLRFNLHLDGAPIDTDSIYLGDTGKHPEHNPFTIER